MDHTHATTETAIEQLELASQGQVVVFPMTELPGQCSTTLERQRRQYGLVDVGLDVAGIRKVPEPIAWYRAEETHETQGQAHT